jgi:hypothetical protein
MTQDEAGQTAAFWERRVDWWAFGHNGFVDNYKNLFINFTIQLQLILNLKS